MNKLIGALMVAFVLVITWNLISDRKQLLQLREFNERVARNRKSEVERQKFQRVQTPSVWNGSEYSFVQYLKSLPGNLETTVLWRSNRFVYFVREMDLEVTMTFDFKSTNDDLVTSAPNVSLKTNPNVIETNSVKTNHTDIIWPK